jgi:hypothetical protein
MCSRLFRATPRQKDPVGKQLENKPTQKATGTHRAHRPDLPDATKPPQRPPKTLIRAPTGLSRCRRVRELASRYVIASISEVTGESTRCFTPSRLPKPVLCLKLPFTSPAKLAKARPGEKLDEPTNGISPTVSLRHPSHVERRTTPKPTNLTRRLTRKLATVPSRVLAASAFDSVWFVAEMIGHLDFQTGLQHLADEPGQQATLPSQIDAVTAGLFNQTLSEVLHQCSFGHHFSRQHSRFDLVVHDVDLSAHDLPVADNQITPLHKVPDRPRSGPRRTAGATCGWSAR